MATDVDYGIDDGDSNISSTFECTLCGKIFLQKRYLAAHKSRCSGRKVIPKKTHLCSLCGKIFSRLSHLRRHESHHLRQNAFQCTVCDQSFVQQHHLQRHFRSKAHIMKQIANQQPLECSSNSSFAGQEGASGSRVDDAASAISASFRRHKCYFCAKAFPTLWEMQRHWRTVHPYAVRKAADRSARHNQGTKTTFLLKCSRCGMRFDNDLLYRNHMEWHQGRRPHKCDHCGVAFARRLEMEAHKSAKHGVGWMFECINCCERFAQRTEIDRHITKVHSSGPTTLARDITTPVHQPLLMSKNPSGGLKLRCKYCDLEFLTVSGHRQHTALHHFRKVFVEQVPSLDTLDDASTSYTDPASDQNGEEDSSSVSIVVKIEPNSGPVHILRLGSRLPTWLVDLQPSYALLDVAMDDHSGPLGPGESIVLQLPLSCPLPAGISKSIRITYPG